jgi:hypothetical protein
MAEGSLAIAPSDESVRRMLEALSKERDDVGKIIKAEVEKLMMWGAEITEMTYFDASADMNRSCLRPRNMRNSCLQDDGLLNLKRIHWIFHELPETLHKDVLMHRMSHMDVVTNKVMRQLNIVWGLKREGEELKRSNCIEKLYSRILNEKKTTIVKAEKNRKRRTPFARNPQTRAKSGNPASYRQGSTEFYWRSAAEGEQVVSCRPATGCHWRVPLTICSFRRLKQVDYRHDTEWNTWNITAKKRILLDDGNHRNCQKVMAPPMADCCVSLRRVSGGTQVSSIGSTNTGSSVASTGETTVALPTQELENQRVSGSATQSSSISSSITRFSVATSDETTVALPTKEWEKQPAAEADAGPVATTPGGSGPGDECPEQGGAVETAFEAGRGDKVSERKEKPGPRKECSDLQ